MVLFQQGPPFLDALECIINYSKDSISLLRRKAITREVLFAYLNECNVPAQSPKFTKPELIKKVLTFWNSHNEEHTNDAGSKTVVKVKEQVPDVNLLATKFAEWFYSLLNGNEVIAEEHFWPDSTLKITLPTSVIEVSNNTCDIVKALFNIKSENDFYFNPNLTCDGTQGRIDLYGLVLVLCCGTLHVNNQIVGVYEQVFSLARDPSAENNWKIKNTQLNLVSKTNVCNQPSLHENELTGNLLCLPEN